MALFKRKKQVIDRERSKAIPFDVETWHYKRFSGELLDIDVIVACIDALARNLAKMELTAIRRDKNNISITDRTSDVAKVLKKPNPYMTQYDFIYKVAAMYFASNNAFIWPEYDEEGNLIALWPINYRSVKMYDKDGIEIISFEMRHGHHYTVPYSQIIHMRNHFMSDDIYGDSNHAFKAIAELMDAQQQGIKGGIKNSALIRGLLKAVQVMKEEDIKAARDRFVADNLDVKNNGGVMFIDGKYDYTPIESKPYVVDADTMKVTREATFSYFGVNDYITREEAATMLYRSMQYLANVNRNYKYSSKTNKRFADDNNVSSWAKESVSIVNDMGVMQGVGNSKFDPKSYYTIEQSIATIYRLYRYNFSRN